MNKLLSHWCYLNNLGDALNPYLLKKLSGENIQYVNYTRPKILFEIKKFLIDCVKFRKYDLNRLKKPETQRPVILAIGSILSRSLPNFMIWGAGFMNNDDSFEGGNIYAVRGKYSAQILYEKGFGYCNVWGDPALLLPLVYNPQITKRYKLGIIPHYSEYSQFKKEYNTENIINLHTTKIEKTIRKIIECHYILSTSLHGLIIAHAYGVPAIWIKKNYIFTDGLKFFDYFSSVDIPKYEGFSNINSLINDINNDIIDPTILTYALPHTNLTVLQNNLLRVAPFPILSKYGYLSNHSKL